MDQQQKEMLEYVVSMIMTYVDVTQNGAVPYKEFKNQVLRFEDRPLLHRGLVLECAGVIHSLAKPSAIKGKLRDLEAVPDSRILAINKFFGTNFT